MPYSVLEHRAQDGSGNLLTNVDVRVRRLTAGAPLAILKADRDGTSQLSNPTVGGYFADGKIRFFVAGGYYQVELLQGGVTLDTFLVGVGLARESDSIPEAGVALTWDTGTSDADPGSGEIRANNASLASATTLYISKTNRSGDSISAFLAALDDSTNPTSKGTLILTEDGGASQAIFTVGAVTDATNYIKLAVSGHSGATSFNGGSNIAFSFARTGDGLSPISGVPNSIDLTGGQIKFPATQNPSADANTLDDYEEGTWTPSITFDTPGDLAVTYGAQIGSYTKIGRFVAITFSITFTAFTHSTAAGTLRINTLPFATANIGGSSRAGVSWQGITKANYTDMLFATTQNGGTTTLIAASGSGVAAAAIAAADMPTGGTPFFASAVYYLA